MDNKLIAFLLHVGFIFQELASTARTSTLFSHYSTRLPWGEWGVPEHPLWARSNHAATLARREVKERFGGYREKACDTRGGKEDFRSRARGGWVVARRPFMREKRR